MKKIECLAVLVLSSTMLSTFAAEPRCPGNIASVPLHLVTRYPFMVQVPGRLEGGLTLQGQLRDVTAACPHSWMCAPFSLLDLRPQPRIQIVLPIRLLQSRKRRFTCAMSSRNPLHLPLRL